MTNKRFAEAEIEIETDLEADPKVLIGRVETNRLIDKEEYSAALVVTAVDLEYILEEHLKRYYQRNKDMIQGEIDNDDFTNDLGKARKEDSGSLNLCISLFEDIYDKHSDDSNYPDWTEEIPRDQWEKSKSFFNKLKRVRNEIAHDRGAFKNIRELNHETYNSEKKIRDLIDSVYEFCKQHSA